MVEMAPAAASQDAARWRATLASVKEATLAQELDQFHPCLAVFPQECTASLCLLGQPNTFPAGRAARDVREPVLGRR
jgi:hypothetical protein